MSHLVIALLFSVRPVDPLAAEALAMAMARSETVRFLIDTLEASNVVVHIESSRELPSNVAGTTRFVTTRGGYRYLRISLAAGLSPRDRSAILAHELQHACELAQSGAADVAGVRQVFERHGHRAGEFYETQAAIDIERSVRIEMRTRTLQAEPVVKFHH